MAEAENETAKAKPARKLTKKEQHERFVETARELGVDESVESFDRAFRKIIPPRRR